MADLPFVVERTHPTVVSVRMKPDRTGWEQWFLLRSDAHHDSLHSDHDLDKQHLEEAKRRNAGIIDLGDAYDVMGGRYDKRADPRTLRPELRHGEYFDMVVSYLAAAYEPYAQQWVLLVRGNHEETVRKNTETDLSERLAERLRMKGSQVLVGTYQGWIRFMFQSHQTARQSYKLRYTHGYGGGGPVTRDVIQAQRQMAYVDADIIASGHTHDSWALTARREVLLDSGRPILKDVEIIKTGTYKCDYEAGEGWGSMKGHPPKPKGAYWIRFWYHVQHRGSHISLEVTRAK